MAEHDPVRVRALELLRVLHSQPDQEWICEIPEFPDVDANEVFPGVLIGDA